jgi:hypothetical protein
MGPGQAQPGNNNTARYRSKYPHIGWAVPAVAILIIGIVLKANYDTVAAFCGTGLGMLGQDLGAAPDCGGAIFASGLGTAMLWIGIPVTLAALIGGGIRLSEERERQRQDDAALGAKLSRLAEPLDSATGVLPTESGTEPPTGSEAADW